MRITFICPPSDWTGGQRVIATHAERLQQRGHHVSVVSPAHRRATVRAILRSLYRTWRWPRGPATGFLDGLSVERKVLDCYRPVGPTDVPNADVVVATWWETAEWVRGYPEAKGAKVYFIQHHEAFEYLPIERVRATYRYPLRKVVVSRWLADVMRDEYGDPSAQVVPNAIDHNLFRSEPRARNKMPTVGFIYSPTPFKGTGVCLEAIRRAKAQVPQLRVISFGIAPVAAHLVADGIEYHLSPSQDLIPKIYSQCDAWLVGSRSEGFGLPVLEAMACRTPVISTPVGAAPELLSGGGGFLVRPEDPENMAESIVRLCDLTEAGWREMSDAAQRTAALYTWDQATELFERSLFEAAASPKK